MERHNNKNNIKHREQWGTQIIDTDLLKKKTRKKSIKKRTKNIKLT